MRCCSAYVLFRLVILSCDRFSPGIMLVGDPACPIASRSRPFALGFHPSWSSCRQFAPIRHIMGPSRPSVDLSLRLRWLTSRTLATAALASATLAIDALTTALATALATAALTTALATTLTAAAARAAPYAPPPGASDGSNPARTARTC